MVRESQQLLLSVEHSVIEYLADKKDKVVNLPLERFAIANENTKSLKLVCPSLDAGKIKRRLSWTLRLRTQGTYKYLQIGILSCCLEHHFDYALHCLDDWCLAKRARDDAKAAHSLRLPC
jgi:hypothetical protein